MCENQSRRSVCRSAPTGAFVIHCLDSTISLFSKSEISTLRVSSVPAQPGLCQAWWEIRMTGFLMMRLIIIKRKIYHHEIEFMSHRHTMIACRNIEQTVATEKYSD